MASGGVVIGKFEVESEPPPGASPSAPPRQEPPPGAVPAAPARHQFANLLRHQLERMARVRAG